MKQSSALITLAVFLCVCTGVAISAPQQKRIPSKVLVNTEPPVRVVSTQELYYYDASNLRAPLPLVPKVLVRFILTESSKGSTEKDEYLKAYGAVSQESASALYPRAEYQLHYSSSKDIKEFVDVLKKMADDPTIDIAPVFSVDGMNAVVDGMYIETTTPLSHETVRIGITRAFGGDAMIHEITPVVNEQGVAMWHVSFRRLFFLGDKKFPTNALTVANILDRGERQPVWVKRAYPKFVFLADPVVASITVTPRSGTVGERRMVELTLLISGKTAQDVVVDEREIPTFFHHKDFRPQSGGKSPLAGFFEHGNPPPLRSERVQTGPHTWKISHRYHFDLYAPEPEWTISHVEIPYLYKGKRVVTRTEPITFFVRPHLDEKHKLSDIPRPYMFPVGKIPDPAPLPASAPVRVYDGVAKMVGGVKMMTMIAMGVVLLSAIGIVYVLCGMLRNLVSRNTNGNGKVVVWDDARLVKALEEARTHTSPRKVLMHMHDVLSTVLHQHVPEIAPRHATYQQWKTLSEEEAHSATFARANVIDVEQLFAELDKRNDRAYDTILRDVAKEHQDHIASQIRELATALRNTPEEMGHEHVSANLWS